MINTSGLALLPFRSSARSSVSMRALHPPALSALPLSALLLFRPPSESGHTWARPLLHQVRENDMTWRSRAGQRQRVEVPAVGRVHSSPIVPSNIHYNTFLDDPILIPQNFLYTQTLDLSGITPKAPKGYLIDGFCIQLMVGYIQAHHHYSSIARCQITDEQYTR